jgi:threonine/homoserine/homoserine lactone efflux protein
LKYFELISAVGLGFIGSMLPGPILSAIFTEILQAGFRRSFKTIFYALISETAIAFSIILLFSFVPINERILSYISLVGAVVLIGMSKTLWKLNRIDAGNQISFSFSKMSLLTATNGLFWTYWITVGIPIAITLNQKMTGGKYLFLGGMEIGWLLGTTLLAFLFSRFRPLLVKPKVIGVVFKIFALTFVYFALEMAYKGIQTLI